MNDRITPARIDILVVGYANAPLVAGTVGLVRDGDEIIVVDPGMVADRSMILDPLAALGIAPEDVTQVFVTHHHLDHTVNIALFPEATIVDFRTWRRGDQVDAHSGEGHKLASNTAIWLTPAIPRRMRRLSSTRPTGSTPSRISGGDRIGRRPSILTRSIRRSSSAGANASSPPSTWSFPGTASRSESADGCQPGRRSTDCRRPTARPAPTDRRSRSPQPSAWPAFRP